MEIQATSFRDPDGACRVFGGRVVRRVVAEKGEEFAAFLDSPGGREMLDRGWLVVTRRLGATEVMDPACSDHSTPSRTGKNTSVNTAATHLTSLSPFGNVHWSVSIRFFKISSRVK